MKKGAEDWDNIFGVDWGHTAPLEIAGSPPQCVGQWVSGDGENGESDDGEGESGGGFGGHTQPAVVHSPHNSTWGRREVGGGRTVLHELRLVCSNAMFPCPSLSRSPCRTSFVYIYIYNVSGAFGPKLYNML